MHHDGSMDGRSWLFFYKILFWEWAQFIPATFVFWSFYLQKSPFAGCERECAACVLAQTISCLFAIVFLSPVVAEEVSASPSFLKGLRALHKRRCLNILISTHVIIEVLGFLWSIKTARSVKESTCSMAIPRALEKKLVKFKLLPLGYRIFIYLLVPIIFGILDYRWKLRVYPDGPRAYAVDREAADSNRPFGPEDEKRNLKATVARMRARLDVNFHEVQRAWIERRKLKTLRKVEDTDGQAKRTLKKVLKDTKGPGASKNKPVVVVRIASSDRNIDTHKDNEEMLDAPMTAPRGMLTDEESALQQSEKGKRATTSRNVLLPPIRNSLSPIKLPPIQNNATEANKKKSKKSKKKSKQKKEDSQLA